jgi:hypothetical protein
LILLTNRHSTSPDLSSSCSVPCPSGAPMFTPCSHPVHTLFTPFLLSQA